METNSIRRVLLVDPLFHVHSILHYRAALISTGFEDAELTVLTSVVSAEETQRLETFRALQPHLQLLLGAMHKPIHNRWQCWKYYGQAMQQVEQILARERFDFVIYLMADHVLPFLALPLARRNFPHQFSLGLRGLVFRHNGLRRTAKSLRGRLLEILDRWILRRALHSGAFRRLAFLDPQAARNAASIGGAAICVGGVDPVEIPEQSSPHARAALGLKPDDFVALLFGSIEDRKGVLETLAIIRDSAIPRERLVVLIAGRATPEFRPQLEAVLLSCQYRIILHDQFISDRDLPNYFAAADCVICAYKNFTASSGVLMHGASCGKLALVSAGGVMEDAVREFRFGEVVALENPAAFAASLERLMNLAPAERAEMSAGALAYARSRDARLYMRQFLTEAESELLLGQQLPSENSALPS